MGKAEMLEQACQSLGGYFGANTKDRFMDKVLETNPEFVEQPDGSVMIVYYKVDDELAKEVVSIVDGGKYSYELLSSSKFDGIDAESKSALQNAFIFVCKDDVGDPAGLRHEAVTMADMLGATAAGVNQNQPYMRSQPALSTIQVLPVKLNFSNRDTGALQIFLNAIPTIEWSRAVPYLSAEVISPGNVIQGGFIQKMGLMRFLMGTAFVQSDSGGSPDEIMANAVSADVAGMNAAAIIDAAIEENRQADLPEELQSDEEAAPATYSSAGMEIFTAPQTLINADEQYRSFEGIAYSHIEGGIADIGAAMSAEERANNQEFFFPGEPGSTRPAPILDRMRPFMSINDVNISVKPTNGMMSHKSAKMKLTLHDRSRLAEIAEFVKPSSFGQTEILLEYGWSHPDWATNEYGKFINCLRVKEKFGVYNTAYSFDDAGQVKITLDMVTKGTAHMNITDIGMSSEVQAKWYFMEKLIEKIRQVRRQVLSDEGMRDVIGMSVISSLSPSNIGDAFDGEKLQELNAFISNSLNSENEDMADLATYMNDLKSSVESFNTTIGDVIAAKITQAKAVGDPFLVKRNGDPLITPWIQPSWQGRGSATISPEDNANYCSLAKIMNLFLGLPIAESGRFEEVQMIFYCFNDRASHMAKYNIGSYPVRIDGDNGFDKLFTAYQEEKIQVSPARFINFMNTNFLSNQAAEAYGFSKLYTRNDDGKVEVTETSNNNPGDTKTFKDAVLEEAYGTTEGLVFKLPRVQMYVEAVPHTADVDPSEAGEPWRPGHGNTILRLHFFDAVATKYAGEADLIKASRNSDIGSIASVLRDVISTEDGDQSQHGIQFKQTMESAVEHGLLEKVVASAAAGGGEFWRPVGGVPRLKHFVKMSMPTINYGSQNCSVKSISADSMHNSKDTTIHMQRAQRNASSDANAPGEQDRGLPLRMMQMKIKIKSLGCPLVSHGQQMFVDFFTGTSVDNTYAVNGLTHDLSPGTFETSFDMVPFGDAYGAYESLDTMIQKASGIVERAQEGE